MQWLYHVGIFKPKENDVELYSGKTSISTVSVMANLRDMKKIAKYLAFLCL